jgi:hypothetical protein
VVQKTELGVPIFVEVPDSLKSVSLIEEDSKRFPDTSGWGYAQFWYAAAASDTFKPFGSDASFGKKVRRCVRGRLAEVARRARGGIFCGCAKMRVHARNMEHSG